MIVQRAQPALCSCRLKTGTEEAEFSLPQGGGFIKPGQLLDKVAPASDLNKKQQFA
jgi:hypothetical protein